MALQPPTPKVLAACVVCFVITYFVTMDRETAQSAFKVCMDSIIRTRKYHMPKTHNSLPPGKSWDVCIVGAGLSGSVVAERYANLMNKTSVMIEKRNHIGGNCYDYVDPETNILMNLYGVHLFHTNIDRVWRYLNKWEKTVPWVRWDHHVVGWVMGKLVPIPVNILTVNSILGTNIRTQEEMDAWLKGVQVKCLGPPVDGQTSEHPIDGCHNARDMAMSRVGKDLYDMVFRWYTTKQWGMDPKNLGAEVTARIPVRNNFDSRYFDDRYQAIPSQGYTQWFARMIDHRNIDIVLNTDYFNVRDSLKGRCGKVYFTGPIDSYFAHVGLEKLEYRSIQFEKIVLDNAQYFQTASQVNYPGPEVNFTRIVEYKHLLRQVSPKTVIVKEFSSDKGDPYYPVPNTRNKELYKRYQKLAEKETGVHFLGRLASYKYFNMDAAIENALEFWTKVEGIKHTDIEPAVPPRAA
mmetsp:Transcript_11177/g.22127  ORF Transcript_11177/g.22127 Transcript_11177/m.22127 type:complete len:463 (+) Transcript_11177:123-1511(+)|eukprot:CAMPEP_0173386508 /NCGR_PEP_ID=MMETSP1356-20130122/9098_1 /TAXON_ID=77927 ORGANISM="Hemiselmis virescens, Strain PCC157" /NCGR_SAMPLE_ID=MMETSP1356 /ASSEMBLY_ACC=CAM_ASM_000847 /LENGTH=462 /DNA_ID=CAMNT_0014342763 /DNA_START=103 /DNA_END=1491 /DNA_ORIENTATION=-